MQRRQLRDYFAGSVNSFVRRFGCCLLDWKFRPEITFAVPCPPRRETHVSGDPEKVGTEMFRLCPFLQTSRQLQESLLNEILNLTLGLVPSGKVAGQVLGGLLEELLEIGSLFDSFQNLKIAADVVRRHEMASIRYVPRTVEKVHSIFTFFASFGQQLLRSGVYLPPMSLELQTDETLPDGVRRIARALVDSGLETVRHEKDPEVAIHELRKRCKESRALLRLVRDEIGNAVYRRENAFFRDLAKPYSDRRDRWVFIECLEGPLMPGSATADDPVRQILETARTNIMAYHCRNISPGRPEGFEEVEANLIEARKRIEGWPIEGNEFRTVRKSLRRVYRRGYDDMLAAKEDPDPEKLHEWRKRVKYLWYHLGFLRPIWAHVVEALADEQHEMSTLLGEDHDIAELRHFLSENPELAGGPDASHAIEGLCASKHESFLQKIWPLGEKLYLETPDVWVDRIGGYWEVSRGTTTE